MAPLFTATWLSDVLPQALGLSRPTLHNSDGDEVVFHEVRFPFSPETTPDQVAERLTAINGLHRENEALWNWLEEPASSRLSKRGDDAENALRWNVTMEDGRTVLGSIEIMDATSIFSVNPVMQDGKVHVTNLQFVKAMQRHLSWSDIGCL